MIEEAARAAAETIGALRAQRHFTVSKFGRHPDGYPHARVVMDGRPYYFHCRYGSWLAPGHLNGKGLLKEPEALLGAEIGREVRFTLAEKARLLRLAEAKEQAKEQEQDHDGRSDEPHGDDASADADRLPDGGDRPNDHQPVRSD
jgi:hypothetical protein